MSAARTVRVLVTGSRSWADEETVHAALLDVWHDAVQLHGPDVRLVVVDGACPRGADAMAGRWAAAQGPTVISERHPADWNAHGRAAGPRRNQAMVDLGADVLLAFVRDGSRGASHTVQRAEAAGIPVRLFTA